MIDRELREVVGIEARQPYIAPPRSSHSDYLFVGDARGALHPSQDVGLIGPGTIPHDAGYLAIALRVRSRFQVGIYVDCYLVGETIAVSQIAGRRIPRFIPLPILYIFRGSGLIETTTSHGALTGPASF
eukprot:6172616-Pleurochrysis_carterae.AAC.1